MELQEKGQGSVQVANLPDLSVASCICDGGASGCLAVTWGTPLYQGTEAQASCPKMSVLIQKSVVVQTF